MTYDQLEMLEMIVEKVSFKAASEAMFKSQPSFSVAIRKLEEEFGIQLFDRSEYRPRLTEQGKAFYQRAKQALAGFRELRVSAIELGQGKLEPHLSIVVDPLVRFDAIEGIFEECMSLSNSTELCFRSEILDQGMKMLIEGTVDFAIAPKMREHVNVESCFFERIEMIPVIAKSALGTSKADDVDFFRRKPQVFVHQDANGFLNKQTIVSTIPNGARCFVTDHSIKTKLICEGFGWGRMAHHEIADELTTGKLVRLHGSLAQSLILDLHVMRLRDRALGPVARAIWKRLLKNVQKKRETQVPLSTRPRELHEN